MDVVEPCYRRWADDAAGNPDVSTAGAIPVDVGRRVHSLPAYVTVHLV